MKYLISFFLCSYFTLGFSQQMFYSSIQRIQPQGSEYKVVIGTFDFLTCQTTELYIDTTDNSAAGHFEWHDIAYCPDGNLYAISYDGIYLIDIIAKTRTKISSGPSGGSPKNIQPGGMTCTKDTVLVFSARDTRIYTFNLKDQKLEYKGRLPDSLFIWSNIYWLDGKLYGSSNLEVVAIDLNNPDNSHLYCTMPTGLLSLTQVTISCDSVALFALYADGDIYLVNPLDWSYSYYCSLPQPGNITYQGSEPSFMFMPPDPCQIEIDLDVMDETATGIDCKDTVLCSLPNQFILSDPDLFSDKDWDSLIVWIESGPPGISLNAIIPPFANINGLQTKYLTIKSLGTSDWSSLSFYLNELKITGSIPSGYSSLKIGFSAYADDLISDTAYAYITLIGRSTSSGRDSSTIVCIHDQPFSLLSLLSDDADQTGYWTPNTNIETTFTPGIDATGVYRYIVNDPFCPPDTSSFVISTYPKQSFDLGADKLICPGDTVVFSLPSNMNVVWQDGSLGPMYTTTIPGEIYARLKDDHNCEYLDSAFVIFKNDCIIENLFIPNIFSPNDDGINDVWEILATDGIENMEITIYDRWGNALFHQNDSSISWNGMDQHQKLLSPGVYAYQLIILTSNLTQEITQGDVTIVR